MSLLQIDELNRMYHSISNVGAERAVLSIAMNDPETLFDIASRIEPEDFANISNRHIYELMLAVLDNKYSNISKVNPMVILSLAQSSGIENTIGGMPYLQAIQNTDAGSDNLHFYINEMLQASVRRKAFLKALSVIDDAVNGENEDTTSFITKQEEKFLDIIMEVENSKNDVIRIGDVIDIVLEKREQNPRDVLGIPTGFPEYDRITGGLIPGRLKVVAATPKTGKSAHALNVAKHISVNLGIPVLYIDTEMQTEEQIDRLLSIIASEKGVVVPTSIIERGAYVKNQVMREAVDGYAKPLIREAPFYHIYMPDFTPDKIYNLARKFQRQHGVTVNGYENQFVLIFDYIKMDDESHKRNISEYQVLGQTTNMLKNKIAGGLNIPVLSYCQINPRVADRQDEITHTSVSGSSRIIMYVNEFSILRRKTEEEISQHGVENGNRVWRIDESRNGGEYEGWIDFGTSKGVPYMREVMNVALS